MTCFLPAAGSQRENEERMLGPYAMERESPSQVKPFSQCHAERAGEKTEKEGESHSGGPLRGCLLVQSVKNGRQVATRRSLLPG